MGMRIGRVHVTMGMATFSCVPKLPLVDSIRIQSNKMYLYAMNTEVMKAVMCFLVNFKNASEMVCTSTPVSYTHLTLPTNREV